MLKKEGFSSFLLFTDQRNSTILVYKKGFLKNFANVPGKNLYWNLFLIKLQVWRPVFKNTYFEEHLRTNASVISKITVNPKDNGFTITMELYYSSML